MKKILLSIITLAFFALWSSHASDRSRDGPEIHESSLSPVAKISTPKSRLWTVVGHHGSSDRWKIAKDGHGPLGRPVQNQPRVCFRFGRGEENGIVRIYFSLGTGDELAEIKVEVSRDGESFVDFNEYEGFVADRGKGLGRKSICGPSRRYFRLSPKFQGCGHLWGRLNFGRSQSRPGLSYFRPFD